MNYSQQEEQAYDYEADTSRGRYKDVMCRGHTSVRYSEVTGGAWGGVQGVCFA
jgi:hypothetical protein